MFFFVKTEYCKADVFDESPVKNVPRDRRPIQWHTRMLDPIQKQQETYLYPMLPSQIADILLVSYMPVYLQSFTFLCISQRIPLHFLF